MLDKKRTKGRRSGRERESAKECIGVWGAEGRERGDHSCGRYLLDGEVRSGSYLKYEVQLLKRYKQSRCIHIKCMGIHT